MIINEPPQKINKPHCCSLFYCICGALLLLCSSLTSLSAVFQLYQDEH